MKKNLTELVFILDRSGSMSGLEADTVGGFNSMLRKQQREEGDAFVSTILFDNVSEVIHDRADIKSVRPMTEKDYVPRGCTALLDAVGDAIQHIGNIHKYAREEDVPEHTLFIITTDGMENASRRHSIDKVKKMIERQKTKYGWEFLFLGANMDAVETAGTFGIAAERAVTYRADSRGTRLNYDVLSEAISDIRCDAALCRVGRAALSKTKAASKNNRAVFHAELFCLFPNNAKSRQRHPAAQTLFTGTP